MRAKAILTIARQLCVHDGKVWERIPQKQQVDYKILAQNILATVERLMSNYRWASEA